MFRRNFVRYALIREGPIQNCGLSSNYIDIKRLGQYRQRNKIHLIIISRRDSLLIDILICTPVTRMLIRRSLVHT